MRYLALACVIACGDNTPPPLEVANGRLVARIEAEPARITLLLDGVEVWATRPGQQPDGANPPQGFAATGTFAVDIDSAFGSFAFTEREPAWQPVERIDAATATADGATFSLVAGGRAIGSGELTFVTATRSGPAPDAAGFARHVRIRLTADAGDRISLAATCDATEHLVGLGGQSFDVDHRGETVPLWVQEDGIGKSADPDDGPLSISGYKHSTHTPMPMLVSSRGYALAVDTNARAKFALGSERPDALRVEAWERTLDLQIFVGDGEPGAAARDALGHMIAWTGKPERPPIGVFAPWVDAIFGSANVRRVANKLRANGIPASAIWTEDWRGGGDTTENPPGYSLDEDWRLDTALYPGFDQLARDLHGRGFALLVYQNTFVDSEADVFDEAVAGGYTIHDGAGQPYLFTGVKFGPSSMLDLANPEAVTWARAEMTAPLALGADGWMADFAEWLPHDAVLASGESALAVHNRYPVEWARMNRELFTAHAASLPANRPPPMWFMRAAWLHSQPAVQVVWAGDQQTDFSDGDGLPSVIPIGINLGLAGFPYFGSDIAGYMSNMTAPTSAELFFRWTSFAALTPVMRTHHGRSARLNVQWEHDDTTLAHFRQWARLHMQLVPYLWGLIGSFERDGLPLMRMLALGYPGEDFAWTTIDEYLLGDRILVAPIQVEGATTRQVQLPAGTWFPLLGGAPVAGGTITATALVTEIPAYVPAGAMLVLYPDGVDSVLAAPAVPSAITASEVGGDREVWLYSGTALDPAHATWNDELGTAGPAQWTWSGRAAGAPPTMATFDGVPVALTAGTVTVIGDGTLDFSGGGRLVIARGDPAARVLVRLR